MCDKSVAYKKGCMKLKLNITEFKNLFEVRFKNNYNFAGRELKIDPAHIYRVVNNESKAGLTFISNLMEYCKENKIDYAKYVNFF